MKLYAIFIFNYRYSMLTSFVIAILTDSAFLIQHFNETYDQIREPLNHTFFYKNEPSLAKFVTRMRSVAYTEVAPIQGYKVNKQLKAMLNYKLVKWRRLTRYGNIEPFFFVLCANPAHYEKLYGYGLVEYETIERARTVLEGDESSAYSNAIKLESALQVGFEVGGNLLSKHWIPNENLTAVIDQYVSKYFEGNYVIGFQFRSHFFDVDNSNINESKDFELFQQCALSIEKTLLGESVVTNEDDAGNSSSTSTPRQIPTKKVMWFISTDNPQVDYVLRDKYPDKVFWVYDDVRGWGRPIVDK